MERLEIHLLKLIEIKKVQAQVDQLNFELAQQKQVKRDEGPSTSEPLHGSSFLD